MFFMRNRQNLGVTVTYMEIYGVDNENKKGAS